MGYMEMLFTKRYRYKAVDHQRSRPFRFLYDWKVFEADYRLVSHFLPASP